MSEIVKNDPQNQPTKPTKAEVIARIEGMKAELKRLEATTGPSGAMPNTPSAILLDAESVKEGKPDKRLRWVALHKAQRRQAQGYVRVPEAELPQGFGPAQKGNLILMEIPRERYDEEVARVRKASRDRLSVHIREAEKVAEGMAKMLRDNHGINVKAEDILLRG